MDEDEIRIDADERRLQQSERVRATLAPRPERHYYPVPWRVAENDNMGRPNVVCADGHYACVAASREAAEAIVLAVNTFAGVAG